MSIRDKELLQKLMEDKVLKACEPWQEKGYELVSTDYDGEAAHAVLRSENKNTGLNCISINERHIKVNDELRKEEWFEGYYRQKKEEVTK